MGVGLPAAAAERILVVAAIGGSMTTTEKLAKALIAAGAPVAMIEKARDGFYDDFRSPLDAPIAALVHDAQRGGLHTIARRAADGEFDGTSEESNAWARSGAPS
jgi:hypothetical protein